MLRICGQFECFAFSESRDSDSVQGCHVAGLRLSARRRRSIPFPGLSSIWSVKLSTVFNHD